MLYIPLPDCATSPRLALNHSTVSYRLLPRQCTSPVLPEPNLAVESGSSLHRSVILVPPVRHNPSIYSVQGVLHSFTRVAFPAVRDASLNSWLTIAARLPPGNLR